uniref:LOW QUALITY PROTEIN: YTH domain-containing protein ECT1 n=1 Tax=Erigeron canadensis TaxID=72917 RepID=UPI001CB94E07|nr:LOW QUALITY PROTEIN: YTH domain-containing protein ECT1 [Erigeron canadensis]
MEKELSQHSQDQDSSPATAISTLPLHDGNGALSDNQVHKPLHPKDERIVSSNPSVNVALAGSARRANNQSGVRSASRSQTPVNSSNTYTAPEQTYYYGGYSDGSVNWGEISNYVNTNNLQILSPAIYNDSSSLLLQPAYGYDPQMTYDQFSPLASPLSPVMIDGQLYSPHQVPVSPSYYQQPVSPTDLSTSTSSSQDGRVENVFYDPASGYYLYYPGSNGLGFYNGPSDSVSNQSTPVGLLGSYEHNFGQQQTPYQGYGYSYTRRWPQSDSYGFDKEVKHRDSDSISLTSDSHATTSDRNRGPRASKPKGSSSADPASNHDLYNKPDFITTYEKAKFFVIKSFSEDNVHRSIKYGVWASTPLGNRKLDAAYQEAQDGGDACRIFLFFSVNASGQFCGVAEMIGPIDFENDSDHWQQDRWCGQFRVQWHIIKDVPNTRFRHILLENNENKPVTHSRDSQEVKLDEGIAMLKIFKEHDADTSILDDFKFYDEREKAIQAKRDKDRSSLTKNNVDDSVNKLSDRVADSLRLDKHKEV